MVLGKDVEEVWSCYILGIVFYVKGIERKGFVGFRRRCVGRVSFLYIYRGFCDFFEGFDSDFEWGRYRVLGRERYMVTFVFVLRD